MSRSFEEEVFESNHKFIAVRAARRTGKTTLIAKWAARQKGHTVVVVPTGSVRRILFDMILSEAQELHPVRSNRLDNYIVISPEQTIHVVMENELAKMRGKKIDNIAIDEAGIVSDDWFDFISRIKVFENPELNVLATGSAVTRNSVLGVIEQFNPSIHYIGYSYLDALKEDVLLEEDLKDVRSFMTKRVFTQEFGPWGGNWVQQNNEGYSYLLTEKG